MMYSLPNLPYEYDALEPVISAEIMRLHHDMHHQGYVNKLNAALDGASELKDRSLVDLLSNLDSIPEQVRLTIRNQGGGHYNHSLFWEIMSPNGGGEPNGALAEKIIGKWGSYDDFVADFDTKAASLFGSGWVWLTRDFEVLAQSNQDTPMMLGKGEPLMGLDVWEHAYYLDYKNHRDEYIKNWWKLINWQFIESRYTDGVK
ncbi:MAG: superoxide dismutase [Candidatus Saccharimonas sp.]